MRVDQYTFDTIRAIVREELARQQMVLYGLDTAHIRVDKCGAIQASLSEEAMQGLRRMIREELQTTREQSSMMPLPVNTLTNEDGTAYKASEARFKRFCLCLDVREPLSKRQTVEGVIFSDGAMIIHGGDIFHLVAVTKSDIKRMLPNATLQMLD